MHSYISILDSNWKINKYDERESLMISQRHRINPLLAKLLNIRGIKEQEVENFINPTIINNLPDPFKLKDMEKSVARTFTALQNNESIAIIADYDVDGSTSVAILYKFFKLLKQNPKIEIPDRLNDGYGPNLKIMNKLNDEKIDLLFTLDCGTSSFNILDNNKYKNIDTIIIDHHLSDELLPNVFSIINPNRRDESNAYNDLAAVGVTFLFILALRKYLREKKYFLLNNIPEPNTLNMLDLVALGTICDYVNLKNYNRSLVKNGLKIIQKRFNKGISKIIDNANIQHPPTVTDLSYIVGPHLNAASRIHDSSLSSKILLSNDLIEIEKISKKLYLLNEKRKLIENKIFQEAMIQSNKQIKNNIIIVKGKFWHIGVIGIIASKIVEKYNKPTIVLSINQKVVMGSGRSIKNIDLGKIILDTKKKDLIVSGGGHKMAVGLKLNNNMVEKFETFLINYFNKFDSNKFKKICYFDSFLSLEEVNLDLLSALETIEPFGNGNIEPKFIIKDIKILKTKILKDKHILIFLKNSFNFNIQGICFNCMDNKLGENLLKNKSKITVICTIKRDYHNKKSQAQIIVHDAIIRN